MKETPKVSVVLPVYNVEAYIDRCIESLRGQTLGELEFVFVDDCSTDGSAAAVEAWAAEDGRVRILRNEQNMGAGRSRNRGIEVARGEYLAFADSDDYVAPDFYQLLYAAATADGGHDIAKGVRRKVNAATGELLPPDKKLNNRIRTQLEGGRPLYAAFTYEHQSAIYRREPFFADGARYGLTRNSEDITFLLRYCYQTNDLVFEESAVYFYVQREGSIVHGDGERIASGQIDALAERLEFLQEKGIDDTAIHYLLGRANACIDRLQRGLEGGDVRREHYDHIATRISEIIGSVPGMIEASSAWPKLQEILSGRPVNQGLRSLRRLRLPHRAVLPR